MVSVRYRLPSPKELVTLNLWKAQRWQAELQSLGFDVSLSVDAPPPAPPGQAVLQTPSASPASASLPSHSVWTGVISQEGKPLPAQLVLDRAGNKVQGELSFRVGDRPYRARVKGTLQGDKITFTSYEEVEGRVFIPTEYEAALEGATLKGTWTYAPEQLQGNFELSLSQP
ncbi:MAG: hypothetical protein JO112_01980 [Planctomycetes bacterium]|nr:hypothetical protein [Planctomycetota bacterium]